MIKQRTFGLAIITCFVVYTFYNNYLNNSLYKENISVGNVEKVITRKSIYVPNESDEYLIKTKGCYIPNYGKTLIIKESKMYHLDCGERAIFITKIENYKIEFRIDKEIIEKYSKHPEMQCYYNFASRSKVPGQEDISLSYTEWKPFKNGTKEQLLEEIITVQCTVPSSGASAKTVYEDAYVFVKKLEAKKQSSEEKTWNVLMVGMDTMSRARFLSSMPRTAQYFQEHGWLDYKGFQKVGYNTFPNLMAILTGKQSGHSNCTKTMSDCNDIFIWSRFHNDGYFTAYGEDSLRLPDTFSRHHGFQIQPTDHYLRPFYLTGEKQAGNLLCAKHKPSAIHLLNYAYEFVNSYKTEKFFGTFWINSYSHNLNHIPTLLDNDMVEFLERLNRSGVLNNTIVAFLSDHGSRYGDMRLPVESYYDERLPMLFVWTPLEFRQLYEQKYLSLQLNQNRLVTPYDLYLTFEEIRNKLKTSDLKSEECPQCKSFFEEKSPYRTCANASVAKKWCSCHDLIEVSANDTAVRMSLKTAVTDIQTYSYTVKTEKCKACRQIRMGTVLRTHVYVDTSDNKKHYVVAWRMSPGGMSFEATVMKEGNNFTIVRPTHTISEYNRRGNCVLNSNDRPYCVCKTNKSCT